MSDTSLPHPFETSRKDNPHLVPFTENRQTVRNTLPLVLVVEDDRTMRGLICRAMEKEGYEVAEAINGKEALEVYSCRHPDIVLLDAVMPEMNGFSCCAQLRTLPDGDRTPIVMITSMEDEAFVDYAFEDGGVTDYVTKPINWPLLRQRVRHLLRRGSGGARIVN